MAVGFLVAGVTFSEGWMHHLPEYRIGALKQQATIADAKMQGQVGSKFSTGMHACLGGTAQFEVGALGFVEAGRGDGETRHHMTPHMLGLSRCPCVFWGTYPPNFMHHG